MTTVLPSLLIADDDRAFRETLCEALAPRGFRTFAAGDGEEALQILRRTPVQVALLDHHMPRLTGLELARRMREERLWLPCILISAGIDDLILAEARRLDLFSVLPKPVRFVEVTALVQRALAAGPTCPPSE